MAPIFFMFSEAEAIFQQLMHQLSANFINKIDLAFAYAKTLRNFIMDFGIDGFDPY